MTTLATRLRETREAARLTQDQLAKKISSDKSQSLIANIESQTNLTSTYLPEIAHALGVDAYWLKTGKGERNGGIALTSDEALLLKALPLIDEDVRQSWIDIAKKKISRIEASKQNAA